MLIKSRLLLGVFLIIYLSFIVNQYQSSIDLGDRISKSASCNTANCKYVYLMGPDEFTSKDKIVEGQQKTMVLFILPILIFLLKNRNIVYILTLLTIVLPIWINIFNILNLFLFILPFTIVVCLTWVWEFPKKAKIIKDDENFDNQHQNL